MLKQKNCLEIEHRRYTEEGETMDEAESRREMSAYSEIKE
jgi:hypothetical protein